MKHQKIELNTPKSDNAMRMKMSPPGYHLRPVAGPSVIAEDEMWRMNGNAHRSIERDNISPGIRGSH